MNYKAPFYAVNLSLYKALSGKKDMEWFDASVPVFEIEDYFRHQAEFDYGIIGAAKADCRPNDDVVLWAVSTDMEVYSNYKGRKRIAEKLETLLNFLSSQEGWDTLQDILHANGFHLWRVTVNNMRINLPVYSEKGIWQSGAASVVLEIAQLEK